MKAGELSRVLLALGAASPGGPAVEAGVDLAAALGAALDALFVEDTNLLRLGSLPLAAETSVLTGARRALAEGEIERALRVEAARLERLLAQSAQRQQVPWSFATARGKLLAEAMSRDADLIVLAATARRPGPLPEPRAPGPVTAVFDASPEATRALAATTRLARSLARSLLILVPTDGHAGRRAARRKAQQWLASEQVAGLVLVLDLAQQTLVGAVRERRSGMLALPVSALAAWPVELAALVEDIECPLVIVR